MGSSPTGKVLPEENKVVWTLDPLSPAADAVLTVTCALSSAGSTHVDVHCGAEGGISAKASAVTQVVTTASLALTVDDPIGPVSVDGEAAYQIRVQNRGTASADGVEVVVYFANHVEPISAEGGRYRLNSGQVVFESLAALAPGQDAAFRIKARADKPGNHVYRVEIHSKSTGDRLVREGNTRFYAGDVGSAASLAAQPAGIPLSPPTTDSRVSDRSDATVPHNARRSDGFQR